MSMSSLVCECGYVKILSSFFLHVAFVILPEGNINNINKTRQIKNVFEHGYSAHHRLTLKYYSVTNYPTIFCKSIQATETNLKKNPYQKIIKTEQVKSKSFYNWQPVSLSWCLVPTAAHDKTLLCNGPDHNSHSHRGTLSLTRGSFVLDYQLWATYLKCTSYPKQYTFIKQQFIYTYI